MPFLRNVPGLEAVYRDYAPKGVQFFLVYKSIVHPGTNGFLEPCSIEERLRHIAIAKQRLKTTVPWLCDTLDGDLVQALHSAPNAEFVIDADGKVLAKKFWHDPNALRAFLVAKVGAVEHPTRVEDLGMTLEFPKAGAPRGLVPPLKMPAERLSILKSSPEIPAGEPGKAEAMPFFAKLLVEGDRALLRGEKGRMYLGFYLDPIYSVHWNNPAGGLSYSIEQPDDPHFKAVVGRTQPFEHEADVDPREFLIDFTPPAAGKVLRLTVQYTVCADDDSFCMPVEQHHTFVIARNPNGASRAGDWMTELVGDPMQYDKDGDGVVTRAELPSERAQIILLHTDRNHDDAIDQREAALFHDMIRIGPGETGR